MEASLQSPHCTRTATPTYERRLYIDHVKEALTPLDKSHGALQESVVVWGLTGIGKRSIALKAAQEICAIDGRHLLVLNGRTCGTLIASFAKAYIAFTGHPLARHEHFIGNFYQFRLHLNRRRREWLMVVLDIGADTEPPSFLPDRGQIIFTNTIGSREREPHRLLSAVAPTFLYVPPLSRKEVRFYSRAHFPELLHMPKGGNGLLEKYHTTLLDLKLIAANMRLLNCSYQAYCSYYSCRIRDRATATMYVLPLAFLPKAIHKEIFWDLLVEHSRWAGRLLAAVTFMDPWSIPVAALRELPLFKNTIAERLQPALELLHALQVINVENDHVSVQPALHTWLRANVPKKCLRADWNALRSAWTLILRNSMSRESASVFDHWSLGIHAWALSTFLSVKKDPPRLESLMFLTSAAKLPIFYVIYRDTLLEDALNLCGSLSSRTPDFTGETYDYYVTKVRLARADDCLPDDVRQADAELRLAIPYIQYIESPHLYWKMKELQWQIEARVLIIQEKYAEAETFLDYLFDRYPLAISIRTRKRLYHLMAVVLTERDKTVAALQYSHDAMNFFAHRYKPDGRPPRVRLAAEVVDAHVDLLIKMKKYRGALLYLVPTIEKMLITLPHRPPVVLKYARQALHCYAALRNLADGERLVLQILEANTNPDCGTREDRSYPFANGLPDDCLLEYIRMLVLLASLFLWHGRFIEAEGVMRSIIAVGLHRVADDMTRFVNCYKDLMLFLYARGHHAMLKRIEGDLKALHGHDYPSEEIDKTLHGYSKTKETYQRALWAAEDGFYGDWWADVLPEGPMRSGFVLAELLWGKVEDRARDRPDFASVDDGGIARAKTSKVLHLLGFDLVGLAFATKLYAQRRTTMRNERDEEIGFYRGLMPHFEKASPDGDNAANIDIDSMPSRSQTPDPGAGSSDRSCSTGASTAHESNDPQRANDASSDNVDVAEQQNDEDQSQRSPLPRRESIKAGMSREKDTDAAMPASPFHQAPPAPRAPKRRRRPIFIERTFPGRIRAPFTEARRSGRRKGDSCLSVIDLWFNHSNQRTLPEYWSWCDCRRYRTRSNSLDRIDLISKRFIREECERADSAAEREALVQKKITDSYIHFPPEPTPRPTSCRDDCPCIAANIQGASDWAEYNLDIISWPSDSPYAARSPVSSRKWNTVSSGRHPLFCPSSPNRYKRSLRPTPSLLPDANFICLTRILASMEADPAAWDAAVTQSQEQDNHEPLAEALWVDEATQQVPLGSSWKFVQSELTPMMERPGENYCLKYSLALPDIVVRLAEDEWCLHGVGGRGRWAWREVREKAELDQVRAVVEFRRIVDGEEGEDGGEWPWEGVKMVEFGEKTPVNEKRRRAWVKWRQRNVYTGEEERWWVLTKSKELLTEYFERGAFGPSQRVKAEKKLKEWICPQEWLAEITEEGEEAGQDKEDPLDESFAKFTRDEAELVRSETELLQAETGLMQHDAADQGGVVDQLVEIQQPPQHEVDDDNEVHDHEAEEDQGARASFYRECWARVANDSTTERS